MQEHIELYERLDDPVWLSKTETFERWYENPLDLPGRWYPQVIDRLFKRNELARGEYVALGRPLALKSITCPLYLLAGQSDDITIPEQVFAAERLCGTHAGAIHKRTVPGGHIGRFMGARTLGDAWLSIGAWIAHAHAPRP